MNSSLFSILNANVQVKLRLGANPLRVYPYGRVPSDPRKPYAAYGLITGLPENYLYDVSDLDNNSLQMTIYADSDAELELAYNAVRDSIELGRHGYITSIATLDLDPDTDLFSVRLEIELKDGR